MNTTLKMFISVELSKSLKNKHTKMIKFVFKTHTSDGWGVSTGDFGIDLYAKI